MNAKAIHLTIAALTVSGLLLSGCVVREETDVYEPPPRRRVVVVEQPPPPVVVAPAPQPVVVAPAPVVVAPAPAVIVVHQPPPAVRVEVRPVAPGRGYVWIDGYYVAHGEHWDWVGGHWERPPHPGAVWVAPRYDRQGAEVHFSMGFWR